MPAQRASKFCATRCAVLPEVFFQSPFSRAIPGEPDNTIVLNTMNIYIMNKCAESNEQNVPKISQKHPNGTKFC
jgi:hypothetical protein